MTDDQSKKRLGRGLAALIGDMDQPMGASDAAETPSVLDGRACMSQLNISAANPNNPETLLFDDAELEGSDQFDSANMA